MNDNRLPFLFHVNNDYWYFGNKVRYIRRDSAYYYFDCNGGNLMIDCEHTDLIKGKRIVNKAYK
jgi:hypothetical protein